MSTDIVRATAGPLEFSADQRQMIRDTYARGATDTEFAVLLEIAQTRHLNPLLRQIFFVKRWDRASGKEVWSSQISIDGLRAVAQRTGLYDGQDEPEFVEKDGRLVACKVRVYRKDWSRPAVGVAHWAEYVQTTKDGGPTAFWARMPHVMLAKCAEALALRKAFPEDTSGLYVPEELAADQSAKRKDAPPPLVTEDGEVLGGAVEESGDRALEMAERIASAASIEALQGIASELKAAPLPQVFGAALKEQWARKRRELTQEAAQ